ncbi:MAG: HNH endonuclease signature motif containing protein, partial [Actinomycetota bacterium]
GCERPFAWCEIHHPDPWSQGGPTDLTNALPLCGYHHQRAHDPHYTLTITPTGEARFRRRPRH